MGDVFTQKKTKIDETLEEVVKKESEFKQSEDSYKAALGKEKTNSLNPFNKEEKFQKGLEAKRVESSYRKYLKENNIAPGTVSGGSSVRKDIEWKNNLVEATQSESWEDLLEKLSENDEEYISKIDTSQMSAVGQGYVNQMKSVVKARKQMVDAYTALDSAYKGQTELLKNEVGNRLYELNNIRPEEYKPWLWNEVYPTEGQIVAGNTKQKASDVDIFKQSMYYDVESQALKQRYSPEELQQIKKNMVNKFAPIGRGGYVVSGTPLKALAEGGPIGAIENVVEMIPENIRDAIGIQDKSIQHKQNNEKQSEAEYRIEEAYKVIDKALALHMKDRVEEIKKASDWSEKSVLPAKESEGKDKKLYDLLEGNGNIFTYSNDEKEAVKYTTDEQKSVIAYLYRSGASEDDIKLYIQTIKSDALKNRAKIKKEEEENFASKNWLTNAMSNAAIVPEGLLEGGKGAFNMIADPITLAVTGVDEKYDANSTRFDYDRKRAAIMGSTKEKLDNSILEAGYDFGMNVADNAVRTAVPAAVGYVVGGPAGAASAATYVAPVLMSGGAYESGVYDALSRGASNSEARNYGLSAAATEFVTERVGIDAIVDGMKIFKQGGKNALLKSISKSGISNAGEETAAFLIEGVYDQAIMGENSNFNLKKKAYIESGKSEKDATNAALVDMGIELLVTAASGAASGALMSAAGGKVARYFEVNDLSKATDDFVNKYLATKTKWDEETDNVFKNLSSAIGDMKKSTINEKTIAKMNELDTRLQKAKQNVLGKGKFDKLTEGLDRVIQRNFTADTWSEDAERVYNNVMEDLQAQADDPENADVREALLEKRDSIRQIRDEKLGIKEDAKVDSETIPGTKRDVEDTVTYDTDAVKRGTDIVVNELSEGSWTDEKEAVYQRTITSLEDMSAKSDNAEFKQGVAEEIDRVKDAYVSGKLGGVISIDAAIEKAKAEEKKLERLWKIGREGQELDSKIEEQIRTVKEKRASLEKLKAFNEAGFNVKYFSAPDKSELNGVIIGNNVYVNLDGEEAVKHTVGHEFVHMLKNANPDAYNSYVNAVMNTIGERTKAKLFEEYTAKYEGKYSGWNEAMFWEEYAADVAGDLVQDVTYGKSLINAIVSENTTNDVKKSKLRAISDVFIELGRKLRRVASVAWRKHTGTYKMGEAASYVSNLVEVHRELLRAYHGLSVDNVSSNDIMESRSSGRGKRKKDYWRPDLSNAELEVLNRKIRHDIKTSTNEVTDTANWMFTSINGKDVFAIYSTTDESNPTLLYESKDNRAKQERDLLIDILEVGTNGESFNGQSSFANRVSEGDWLQNEYSVAGRSDGVLRRKGSVGNASVLQGESSTYGSAAFRNVIENLFEIQDGINSEYAADKDGEIYVKNEPRMSVSSPDVEERSSMENRAYEIETAVSDRLSEMLEVKLTDATRDAVKVYALSSAMGDDARIRASLNNLTDSIMRNEAPVTEVQAEDDGFLETLRGIKKVYVSDYARQGMSVSDVNRTFGIGRWSGKEGLPVDVLYNNMKADGITLPKAETLQDKLIAIRDRKAELIEVRREALPRDEVRSIIDYAVDLGYYETSGISKDTPVPEAAESRTILDEEFKSQRRALQEEIDNLPEDAYEDRLRLTQEKNQLEKDFVEGYIAHGKAKSTRGIAMDFCAMTEAEEQVARAKLRRSEEAAREARGYARENGMTQAMTSAARAMAEGNMDESELNTKYRNASDRVKIMELSELYKRVSYTAQNLKSEQRATLYEVCDILFKNASYMKDIAGKISVFGLTDIPIGGQIDTFESLVNYICRVDSLKDSFSSKNVPEDVRRELTWAAKQLNDIFYYSIQDNTEGMNSWKDGYKKKLSELGIRKRSAESAAAQALGEGFWNEDDLTRAGFNEKQRKNIIELSNYLKEMYKEILPEINKIRFSQGEGDISAPTFKVDRQTAGEISRMLWTVDFIKYNSKAIDALKASDVKEYADRNGIRVEAIEAYRAYGNDEFAKHINWRYKNAQGRSEGDMAQWAWNLIQSGKRYDRSRDTIEMDYFPHLEKDDNKSTVLRFLNIKKTIDKLPTAISGMTENFKPNKKWSPFMQERLGNETEWDAMTGAERYLDGIGMYMYHASDITKVRILENYIREKFESGVVLSGFVDYLRQYGDDLAGKQHAFDRGFQRTFTGRRLAQWWRALMTNISRNQLGANISTTITNSALMGQGVSWVIRETIYEKDLGNLVKIFNTGMGNSKAYIEKSTFLKNRFHDDVQLLDKSRAINVIAKINNGMFKPMQMVDMVVSTRVHKMITAVYMNQGMSEADAIENADIALRQLAASREYGEKPLIFSSNTASIVTKYTLEPLNQMRYYKNQFARMTQAIMDGSDMKMKATVKTAGMLMLAIAADALIMHLLNHAFKKLKGYPVVMDPVQMAIDAWGNIKEGDIQGAWLDVIDEVPIANNIIKAMNGEVTDMIVVGNLIDFVGEACKIPSGKTNWEEFLWNAGMIFNPLGGTAQAKKMVQAYGYLTKGYQEKDGKVQHATDATAWDWAVGMLFGKSAIPSVQEWYDGGFNKLTKKSSEMFKEYRGKAGMSDTELYEVLKSYDSAEYIIDGESKSKNLSKQSREIFSIIFDEYDQSFVGVYEMLLEYDKKKASKEEEYDAYKWVTEDIEKYGTFSTYDKYYLWHMMKDRKCDIPERFTEAERKIAEVFIATGDESILVKEMSDSFTIDGYGKSTTYHLSEDDVEILQGEYERIFFDKIVHNYKDITNSEDFSNERWIEFFKKASGEAVEEARNTAVKKGWYESEVAEDIVSTDYFGMMKTDMEEKELSSVEAFWTYIDAKNKKYVMPDWQNPTKGQKILAEAFTACDEEPEDVLPVSKSAEFTDGGKKYKLTKEQHEEFQKFYLQYYWDRVEEMDGWSSEEIMAELPSIRKDATSYSKSQMFETYGDALMVEE